MALLLLNDKVVFKDPLNNLTCAPLGLLAENGYGAGVSVEPILILLLSYSIGSHGSLNINQLRSIVAQGLLFG